MGWLRHRQLRVKKIGCQKMGFGLIQFHLALILAIGLCLCGIEAWQRPCLWSWPLDLCPWARVPVHDRGRGHELRGSLIVIDPLACRSPVFRCARASAGDCGREQRNVYPQRSGVLLCCVAFVVGRWCCCRSWVQLLGRRSVFCVVLAVLVVRCLLLLAMAVFLSL